MYVNIAILVVILFLLVALVYTLMNKPSGLMQQRTEIKEQILRLTLHCAELKRLEDISWLEEAQMRQRFDFPVSNEVSLSFHQSICVIRDQIAHLESQLPCDELLDRYGEDFYLKFSDKYPINHNTKVVNAYTNTKDFWYIAGDSYDCMVLSFDSEGIPPPSRDNQKRSVQFTMFVREINSSSYEHISAGYAEDINTIFIRKPAR